MQVQVMFKRDDGRTLVFDGTDWEILSMDGIASPNYEVYTSKNGMSDGARVTGKYTGTRDIEIKAEVLNTLNNLQLRTQALRFFTPKQAYQIYITYGNTTLWIEGNLIALKAPAEYEGTPQVVDVYFICAEPYFNSIDNFGYDIAGEMGLSGFPFMESETIETVVSAFAFSSTVQIDYDGDISAPIIATLTFDDEVANPEILKDSYFLKLLGTYGSSDKIVIDFDRGTVRNNGINILNKVDRQSNLTQIKMDKGLNEISYTADVGENSMHIALSFYKKYLGV